MKNWKAVVLTVVVILLVAMLIPIIKNHWETRAIRSRIAKFELIWQEQKLATDILKARYDAAVIQSKFNPAPPAIEPPKVKE